MNAVISMPIKSWWEITVTQELTVEQTVSDAIRMDRPALFAKPHFSLQKMASVTPAQTTALNAPSMEAAHLVVRVFTC